MRKLLSFALTASLISTASFAQQNQNPVLHLGKVAVNQQSGKGANAIGTREDILADPRVILVGVNAAITEFTFSMKPQGGEYWGPFKVKGDKLPPNVIQRIKELNPPEGMLYIESIMAKGQDGFQRHLVPIIMKMVPAKK